MLLSSLFLLWLWLPLTVLGGLVNRTIDDAQGSDSFGAVITYSSGWNSNSAQKPCTSCVEQPDGSQFLKQTWHDGSAGFDNPNVQITLEFTGVAVSIFAALDRDGVQKIALETALQFTLDGSAVGDFTFHPQSTTGTESFLYNQMVFSKGGLSNGPHSLVVHVLAPSTSFFSFLLFDYAMYTQVIPDPIPPQGNNGNNQPSPPSDSKPAPAPPSSSSSPPASSNALPVIPSSSSAPKSSSSTPLSTPISSQPQQQNSPLFTPPPTPSSDAANASPSSPSAAIAHNTPNIGAIAGGVIAGVLFLIILALVVYIYRRRTQASTSRRLEETPIAMVQPQERPATMTPFTLNPDPFANEISNNNNTVSSRSGSSGFMSAAQEKRALMTRNPHQLPQGAANPAGPSSVGGNFNVLPVDNSSRQALVPSPAPASQATTHSHSHSHSNSQAFSQSDVYDTAPPEYAR